MRVVICDDSAGGPLRTGGLVSFRKEGPGGDLLAPARP